MRTQIYKSVSILFCVSFFIVLIGYFVIGSASNEDNQSKGQPSDLLTLAKLTRTTVNCGFVMSGAIIEEHFDVINISEGELNLLIGPTSCFCTEVSVDRPVLLPGEKSVVRTVVDLSGKRGPANLSVLLIMTSEKENKEEMIPLRLVVAGIDNTKGIIPSELSFGRVPRNGDTIEKKFRVSLPKNELIELTIEHRPLERLGFKLKLSEPSIRDDRAEYEGSLFFDPLSAPTDVSDFADSLELLATSTNGTSQHLKLNTGVMLIDHIRARPGVLYWQQPYSDAGAEVTIILSAADKALLKIIDVSCDKEGLVTWEVEENYVELPRLTVTRVSAPQSNKVLRARMLVVVEDGKEDRFTIQIPIIVM